MAADMITFSQLDFRLTIVLDNSLQTAWHLLSLVIVSGRPDRLNELVSRCKFLRFTLHLIGSLCSMPHEYLTPNQVIYITRSAFMAFTQALWNMWCGLAFVPRSLRYLEWKGSLENVTKVYSRKRKRNVVEIQALPGGDMVACGGKCPPIFLDLSIQAQTMCAKALVAGIWMLVIMSIDYLFGLIFTKQKLKQDYVEKGHSAGERHKSIGTDGKPISTSHKNQVQESLPAFEGFIVKEEVGSGGYGAVYKEIRKLDGVTLAIKCPRGNTNVHHVRNERKMLKQYGGENIILKYEASFKHGSAACLVLQHVEHERPEVLKKEINLFQLQWYGYCLLRALFSLHDQVESVPPFFGFIYSSSNNVFKGIWVLVIVSIDYLFGIIFTKQKLKQDYVEKGHSAGERHKSIGTDGKPFSTSHKNQVQESLPAFEGFIVKEEVGSGGKCPPIFLDLSTQAQTMCAKDYVEKGHSAGERHKSIGTDGKPFSTYHKNQVQESVPAFEGFIVKEEVGSGGYGAVYKAIRKLDGVTLAIKCPRGNTNIHHVRNKRKMLKQYGGENFILKYEGSFKHGSAACLVLQHVEHERPEVLKKEIDLFQLQWYGYCLFRALFSLHDQGVIQRDVKPGNFLFSRMANKGYLIDCNLSVNLYKKYGTTESSPPAKSGPSNKVHSDERLKEPIPFQGRKELISLAAKAMHGPNQEAASPPTSKRKRIASPRDSNPVYMTPMPLLSSGVPIACAGIVKSRGGIGKTKEECPCVGTKGFRVPERRRRRQGISSNSATGL